MRPFLVTLLAAACATAAAPPAPWRLTDEDRRFLDEVATFLVDPRGGERVLVPVVERDGIFRRVIDRPAWRFPGGKLLDTDGKPLLPRGGVKRIDFLAECRAVLRQEPIRLVPTKLPLPQADSPDLELAAWCRRLGQEGLAAHFLARLEGRRQAVTELREALAGKSYAAMVYAFKAHADAEALAHGEHMLRLSGDANMARHAAELVEDLRRRQKAGTFGTVRPLRPAGFDRWPVARRVAHLVESLEDADASQLNAWLSSERFDDEARVRALSDLGEAAVPALLDALEKDKRFTRSVLAATPWSRTPTVLMVRGTAWTALIRIIGSEAFVRGESRSVGSLRAYWKQYGHLPTPRRMMAHLTDPKAEPGVWRAAAGLLAHLGAPALALDRPSAGEAILAALDRDRPVPDELDVESGYLDDLAALGDPRPLPVLHARWKASKGATRWKLAGCCRRLGSSGPIDAMARAFEARPAAWDEIGWALRALERAGRPAADRALLSITPLGHPMGDLLRKEWYGVTGFWDIDFRPHPYHVPLLAPLLADETPTGATWEVGDLGPVRRSSEGDQFTEEMPRELQNRAARWDLVRERRRDLAADRLSSWVVGVPYTSPLLKDDAARRKALAATLERLRYRAATAAEAKVFGEGHVLLPDIRRLGRAATPADLRAGRAVFHLPEGRPLAMDLPAVAEVKGERGLVVQAEAAADGTAVYGVLFRHDLRRIEARDVTRLSPLSR